MGPGKFGMEVSRQPCKQCTQETRHDISDSKIMHLPLLNPCPAPHKKKKKNYYLELSSCAANAHFIYVIKGEQDQVELFPRWKGIMRKGETAATCPHQKRGKGRNKHNQAREKYLLKALLQNFDCHFSTCRMKARKGKKMFREGKNKTKFNTPFIKAATKGNGKENRGEMVEYSN